MRYILGSEGTFADLAQPGAMAAKLREMLPVPLTADAMRRRREEVRRKFDWSVLVPEYMAMFHRVAELGRRAAGKGRKHPATT
jgi:hypothetical protein